MKSPSTILHSFVTAFGALLLSTGLLHAAAGDQALKVLAEDGTFNDHFGNSVAISGTTGIIGAPFNDENGNNSGAAYLFDAITGAQLAKLVPNDAAAGDEFGWSVGISGTIAIVGAHRDDDNGSLSGSAYLFDTHTGSQIAKLLPTDGASGDFFGGSVGISGPRAIVGAYLNDDFGTSSGSAYLFDLVTFSQVAKLTPSDSAGGDQFGLSVATFGATSIVGSYADDDNGNGSGSAYLFDSDNGAQLVKLLPGDGAASDNFGWSVAIGGSTAIVGARRDADNGTDSGSAYLFDTTGNQIAKLLPSDVSSGDFFGTAVGLSGTSAIVGSYQDDDNGSDSGSVYQF